MKILLLILLSVSFFGCASRTRRDPKRAALHLKIGTAHLSKGNYPSALSELLTAQQYDPESPVIYNNLGLAYFVRHKYELAAQNMLKAIELEPAFTEARNNLGRVYITQKKYNAAVLQLQIAIEDLTYNFPEKSYANLGIAYFYQNNFAQAKEMLEKSIELRRDNCHAYHYFGRTLFQLQDYEKSAIALDQAIRLCKEVKLEEPHYYSGLSYYKLGQVEQATARFEELVSLYPMGQYNKQAKEMLRQLQ